MALEEKTETEKFVVKRLSLLKSLIPIYGVYHSIKEDWRRQDWKERNRGKITGRDLSDSLGDIHTMYGLSFMNSLALMDALLYYC